MEYMHELKEKLEKELKEMTKSGKLSIDMVDKLVATIYRICKMDAMKDEGYSYDDGYDNGSSYARRGMHYVRGHYSRDGGMNNSEYHGMTYSRATGYSRHDAKHTMISNLEAMMGDAETEKEREAIRRCLEQIENS